MKRLAALFAFFAMTAGLNAQQWAPVGENIRTQWADEIDPSAPLPEYPRPQMVRSAWMNLNGLWNYAVTEASSESFVPEGKILVPFALESSLSGVGRRFTRDNALWYEREFTVPRSWKGKNVILHFGAVDWMAEVYVNNVLIGEHKGGYDPFSFDVTPALKKSGKQTLKVKVQDATDNSFQPRGKQCIINAGIWYTPVTGIWQTVWMEPVSSAYVKNYYAVSDIDKGEIAFEVDARTADGDVVKVALLEGGIGYSAESPSQTVLAETVVENGKAVVKVADVKTWSPDSPYLYGVKVSVERNGKVVDSVDGYTAMRKISVAVDSSPNRYKRMALNNELLFHFGPLDQGWWPDGLYTAPTDEALEFDVVKTKELGFNMIRKHIKVEPARWYYYCDLHGVMVWQDMPCIGDHSKTVMPARDEDIRNIVSNKWSSDSFFGGTYCDVPVQWKDNYYREWANIINALKNFQCIVVWVPFNEAWGQFDSAKACEAIRALDATRPIDHASGWYDQRIGDLRSLHVYFKPYRYQTDKLGRATILSEFGGYNLKVSGHCFNEDEYGYKKLQNPEALWTAYEKLYRTEILPAVAQGLSASVYTQLTDVEDELNGVMTYDRAVVKLPKDRLSALNQEIAQAGRKGTV